MVDSEFPVVAGCAGAGGAGDGVDEGAGGGVVDAAAAGEGVALDGVI